MNKVIDVSKEPRSGARKFAKRGMSTVTTFRFDHNYCVDNVQCTMHNVQSTSRTTESPRVAPPPPGLSPDNGGGVTGVTKPFFVREDLAFGFSGDASGVTNGTNCWDDGEW